MGLRASAVLLAGMAALAACADSGVTGPTADPGPGGPGASGSDGGTRPGSGGGADGAAATSGAPCTSATPLSVRFYDAGQALSALLMLPDGRHVLVDAGESPTRPCSGCAAWHQRVMQGLARDLATNKLDALWITHQHSDHVGGAEDVLTTFGAVLYVDNGLDLDKTAVVRNARAAATSTSSTIHVVDPEHPTDPIAAATGVKFTAIVPAGWPSTCAGDPNACSIGLRVDYCTSSILFSGDATVAEESVWDLQGAVTLLQVAHHGSDTSTGAAFLQRAQPKYAVISAGKPGEGTNATYCHPSAGVVTNLTTALGGAGSRTMRAFDSTKTCTSDTSVNWLDVPASDRLWLTARDGDVVLKTIGDGTFGSD